MSNLIFFAFLRVSVYSIYRLKTDLKTDIQGFMKRELLFIIFAEESGFITAEELAEIEAAWAADRSKSFIERLRGKITDEQFETINKLVSLSLKKKVTSENRKEKEREEESQNPLTEEPLSENVKKKDSSDFLLSTLGGEFSFANEKQNGNKTVEKTEKSGKRKILSDNSEHIVNEESGHYTMHGEKGHGGIGRVLIAYDEYIGRQIAVKELLPEIDFSGSGGSGTSSPLTGTYNVMRTRFLREARITGQLEHPSIIPVYEIGRHEDGTLYYTMHLVNGKTLSQTIEDSGTLGKRLSLLHHFYNLCNATAFAHSKNVIHRDIKPDNVMIGEFGETVVLDWGLAKVKGEKDEGASKLKKNIHLLKEADGDKTIAGHALGTPAYMPPEQALGEVEEIDEKSDIYSLGAVLFQILTGKTPIKGNNAFEIISNVVNGDVLKIKELEADAPDELTAIAEKAMAHDKEHRYENAKTLADEIKTYMSGEKVSVYNYSSWQLFKRFAKKNKPALVATILIFVVIVSALISISISYKNLQIARLKELKEKKRAHYSVAQALNEKASMLEKEQKLLTSRIYASSSLLYNPANQKSPFYDSDFSKTHPLSLHLKADAISKIYREKLTLSASLIFSRQTSDPLYDASFSIDDNYLAAGSFNGNVEVWDIYGKKFKSLKAHKKGVKAVKFSPSGKLVVSVSYDNTITLWDKKTWNRLTVLEGHSDGVRDLSFSKDGRYLASCGNDQIVIIWDLLTGAALKQLKGHNDTVNSVAFSPDGKRVVSVSYNRTVFIWDIEKGKIMHNLKGHAGNVVKVNFSSDGKLIGTTSNDKTAILWNAVTGEKLFTYRDHKDPINDISFSPTGKYVATASWDKTVKIWSIKTGKTMLTIDAHDGNVSAISFSSDGKYLASSGFDRTIKLWKINSENVQKSMEGHKRGIWRIKFSDDGNRIVSSSWDKTLRTWAYKSGKELKVFKGHTGTTYSCDFSPDGKYVASASWDKSIKIWDSFTGEEISSIKAHKGEVMDISFSPDGNLIASSSVDKTVKIWDIKTGELLKTLLGHTAQIWDIAFSHDGKLIASASHDKSVKIWAVSSGALLKDFRDFDDWVSSVQFFKGGKRVITSGRDNSISII